MSPRYCNVNPDTCVPVGDVCGSMLIRVWKAVPSALNFTQPQLENDSFVAITGDAMSM